MSIQSVARWHWLIISALVGLLLWGAQRPDKDDLPASGESINDQRTFERRLLTQLGGQPLFKDVAVSRHVLASESAQPRTVYVVTGKSCDGTVQPDGKYHWLPAFFVAPVPYFPTDQAISRGVKFDFVSAFRAGAQPTVLDFLVAAKATGRVSYSVAWWRTYPFAAWFGGSVLLIGVIWPCLIDLVYFGRLIRPRQPRGQSLANVIGTTTKPKAAAVEIPISADQDSQEQIETITAPTPPAAAAPPPVHPLSSDSPVAAAAENREQSEFAVKPEDFYPTQKRRKAGGT